MKNCRALAALARPAGGERGTGLGTTAADAGVAGLSANELGVAGMVDMIAGRHGFQIDTLQSSKGFIDGGKVRVRQATALMHQGKLERAVDDSRGPTATMSWRAVTEARRSTRVAASRDTAHGAHGAPWPPPQLLQLPWAHATAQGRCLRGLLVLSDKACGSDVKG